MAVNPGLLTQRTELRDIFTRYVALLWISSFRSGIQSAATRGEGREGGWWWGHSPGPGGAGVVLHPWCCSTWGKYLAEGTPPPLSSPSSFPRHPRQTPPISKHSAEALFSAVSSLTRRHPGQAQRHGAPAPKREDVLKSRRSSAKPCAELAKALKEKTAVLPAPRLWREVAEPPF